GYRIVAERFTVIPIALALGISPQGMPFRFINRILGVLTRMMPGLLGYQIMLVGRTISKGSDLAADGTISSTCRSRRVRCSGEPSSIEAGSSVELSDSY